MTHHRVPHGPSHGCDQEEKENTGAQEGNKPSQSQGVPKGSPGYSPAGLPWATAREAWDRLHRSRYPLAADEFADGVHREPRETALERWHIETHPKTLWGIVAIDVDETDAVLRGLSAIGNHPMPNFIVENPANGHAHVGWALTVPIKITNYGSRRAVRYGLAIEEALRRAVGGDPAYTGRLIKNPLSSRWLTHWLHDKPYTLAQLAPTLLRAGHMPTRGWHTARRRVPVGHSRNETLFHSVRHFGYREIRHHWGDPDGYRAAIAARVAILNAEFPTPLPDNELGHIARSISDWTIQHSRMWNDGPAVYDATFTAIQAARGRKGGLASSGRPGGRAGDSRPGGLVAGAARGAARAEASRRLRDALAEAALS